MLVLTLTLLLSAICMTGCRDPLEAKIRELDNAYIQLGTAYYYAVEACAYSDVYEDEDIAEKFDAWKRILKNAKKEKQAYLDYDEGQIDELITKWQATTEELNKMTERYQYVPEV